MLAIALLVALVSFVATTRTASAQFTACGLVPTYGVDLRALPPNCFPFPLKTVWNNGNLSWPNTGTYPAAGLYNENPPVAVSAPLNFIVVNGQVIAPGPGQVNVNTPCGPACVVTCFDPLNTTCFVIKVFLGGCPVPPAPPAPCP